jgi:regulator of replication initiation timing
MDTDDLLSKIRRQRFLQNALAEGFHLSKEVLEPGRPVSVPIGRKPIAKFALAAACLMAAAGLLSLSGRFKSAVHTHDQARVTAPASSAFVYSTEKASRAPASQESLHAKDSPNAPATVAARNSELELASLKQQVAELTAEKARLADESESLQAEVSQLKASASQDAEALSEANAKYNRLSNEDAQAISTIVAQKTAIQQLQEKEELQTANAERERQLNDAAKDVRQLMGARNLHIIDVHDLVAPDRKDKAFGRVFYAEGQSLVFYAFDLGKNVQTSKVIFQAWGHREGRESDVKSLGIFHVDHDAQTRWVLRVNDPELLSKIDTLYVTVEPAPGRDRPSGKKLLVAYLGGDPNHP